MKFTILKYKLAATITVPFLLFLASCSTIPENPNDRERAERKTITIIEKSSSDKEKSDVTITIENGQAKLTTKDKSLKTAIREEIFVQPPTKTKKKKVQLPITKLDENADNSASKYTDSNEMPELYRNAFINDNKEDVKIAIRLLQKMPSKEFSKYIDFLFVNGVDTSYETDQIQRYLAEMATEEHIPILLPYLNSQVPLQADIATRFLVEIGDPVFENLLNAINDNDPKQEIAKATVYTIPFKNGLSPENKITLLHAAFEKTGCYGIPMLNTARLLKDFSSKGHEIFRACLENPYVSRLAANSITKIYPHINEIEKEKYVLVLNNVFENPAIRNKDKIKEALFALGSTSSELESSMLEQLRNPKSNNTLTIANQLILKDIHRSEAKDVYIRRIFNEKSPEKGVKNKLPQLGAHIDFLMPDIIAGIESEPNQKIRQKALIYLIHVVNPNAFYSVAKPNPNSPEDLIKLADIFEPYKARLKVVSQVGEFEKGYIDMLFENLSWKNE